MKDCSVKTSIIKIVNFKIHPIFLDKDYKSLFRDKIK